MYKILKISPFMEKMYILCLLEHAWRGFRCALRFQNVQMSSEWNSTLATLTQFNWFACKNSRPCVGPDQAGCWPLFTGPDQHGFGPRWSGTPSLNWLCPSYLRLSLLPVDLCLTPNYCTHATHQHRIMQQLYDFIKIFYSVICVSQGTHKRFCYFLFCIFLNAFPHFKLLIEIRGGGETCPKDEVTYGHQMWDISLLTSTLMLLQWLSSNTLHCLQGE